MLPLINVKNNMRLFFVFNCLVTFNCVFAQSTDSSSMVTDCVSEINFPGGRIAMSFDGNQHDPDDVGALPMSLAFTWAAGLKDNVTFVEHSNHICNVNNVLHGKMKESAAGVIERFGYDANRIHDFYSDPAAATAKFVVEINKSTANNPLWIIAAGPMESIWRAINQSNKNVLSHVSIVSHSTWNEVHGDCGEDSHTFEDLRVFEQNNGLSLLEIKDQNASNGEDDFSTPRHKWYWLRDSADPNLAWVYTRDQFKTGDFAKFDPSDSGMVYWLITGGPNGGNEIGGPTEAQNLLENPCSGSIEDKPVISLKFPVGDYEVSLGYDLKVEVAVSDPDGIAQAEIFVNENAIRPERFAPYEWGHDASSDPNELNGLPVGEHEIKIVATDNVGATNETSFQLKVTDNVLSSTQIGDSEGSFSAYPNPNDSGRFILSEKAKWQLFTASGVRILDGNSASVVYENLPIGLYFLNAKRGTSTETLKLIVR